MLEPVTDLPLFVYGTLTDSAFTSRLLGRRVEAEPATLVGFKRRIFSGFEYPVVVEVPDGRVEGLLYRNLAVADYSRLDAYEGVREDLYRRIVARVSARGAEATEGAFVYVPGERILRRCGVPASG